MTHPETLHGSGEGPAPTVPAAPPPDSAGEQDVLGRRISAALVDLVLLAGLFVILSAAVGQTTVSGGNFNVSLSGRWAAVFLAVALLYYFVFEAWAGQTLGKRLLGLRVLRAGGTRPSVGAVAGRTLLRIVDWLPLLYLVGFVTMMATGARRQRIGDLAARTVLARVPVRHRGLMAVPLAVVVLAAVALPVYRATSAAGTQTYRGHGVSFGYPAAWSEESAHGVGGVANRLWTTAVGPGTLRDLIAVTAYRMNQPVTAQNIDALTPDLASKVKQAFGQAGGGVQASPEKITMAAEPALRFRATGTTQDGTPYASTIVFAFNGTTEYIVNCQYTPAKAAEVERACDQVTGSFQVSGAAPATAAQGSTVTIFVQPATPTNTAPGSSPASGTSGNGGLGAKVVPAPSGFTLSSNGPLSAADFNRYWGNAASNHFVRGYDVIYDSDSTNGGIEVTLFQFATPQDAAAFKADWVAGGPVTSKADPVIPGADDYDSKSIWRGMYDHGVIAAKGNRAFVIDDTTGSANPVPLVETMAGQQYAAL